MPFNIIKQVKQGFPDYGKDIEKALKGGKDLEALKDAIGHEFSLFRSQLEERGMWPPSGKVDADNTLVSEKTFNAVVGYGVFKKKKFELTLSSSYSIVEGKPVPPHW